MKHIPKPRKPSPAMFVAIAALSVSLVGTAFAGPIAEISVLNKKDKRVVRKISRNISGRVSNRRITKRAPGLAVASANTASTANTANTVADNAIDASKIADDAVTTVKIAAGAVNSTKVDGSIQKTADLLSAIVDNGGNLVRGNGAVSSSNPNTGEYLVTFNRNIDACVPVATPRLLATPRYATARADTGAADTVEVHIWDPTGAASSFQFNLLMLC